MLVRPSWTLAMLQLLCQPERIDLEANYSRYKVAICIAFDDSVPFARPRQATPFCCRRYTGRAFRAHALTFVFPARRMLSSCRDRGLHFRSGRSEEHTSELQSLRHLVC